MIELKKVSKTYGEKVIYENFDFTFKDNEITAVLGASGVGKTTLLNMIAGLTEYSGEIKKDGDISFVFQTDRLIKNLTVYENLKLIVPNADINGFYRLQTPTQKNFPRVWQGALPYFARFFIHRKFCLWTSRL